MQKKKVEPGAFDRFKALTEAIASVPKEELDERARRDNRHKKRKKRKKT